MELKKDNARKFNTSLKNAITKLINEKVKVEIINSHNFPNCWVRVYPQTFFSNDFRLMVFVGFGNKIEDLLNINDVSYGNIQPYYISGKVFQWEQLFNNIPEQNN